MCKHRALQINTITNNSSHSQKDSFILIKFHLSPKTIKSNNHYIMIKNNNRDKIEKIILTINSNNNINNYNMISRIKITKGNYPYIDNSNNSTRTIKDLINWGKS